MNMNASEKLLWSLLDKFRESPQVLSESVEMSLQIMAWAKLSRLEKIPLELRLSKSTKHMGILELESVFKKLSEYQNLGIYQNIFQIDFRRGFNIQENLLNSVLDTVKDATENMILDNCQLVLSNFLTSERAFTEFYIPQEIVCLMIALGNEIKSKEIYCLFDELFTFSSHLQSSGAKVFVENKLVSPTTLSVAILNDLDIEIKLGSPLSQPSYISNGKLKKFDISLSFPPLNLKYDSRIIKEDWFNRFPEQTNSGNVLHIRHILSQTKSLAVIACSQSLLFSLGGEESLRKDILNQRILKAVINLPSALLPFTSIPFSILVFDKTKKHETVRFFQGDNEQFYIKDGRNRTQLKNWESLLTSFNSSSDQSVTRNVTIEEIEANNFNLSVNRYLSPPETKRINSILRQSDKVLILDDSVSFIRPIVTIKVQNDNTEKILIHEFGVSDFPDFGYLKQSLKPIEFPTLEMSKKNIDSFLKPHDVLIAVKGSVGKVAIVPENVPSAGEGGWVVNQSCLILRSNRQIIDPRVLFMYLRSDVAQFLLRSIVSGATISLIQLRSLKHLQVVIPPLSESERIISAFEKQIDYQSQIDNLKQKQIDLNKLIWAL